MTSTAIGIQALRAMRTERRKNRVADMDWFEALYRVYISAFLGGGAILFLSGVISDQPLSAPDLNNVVTNTPHAIGLVTAIIVFIGMRSGANGGPIAVEEPEVRHVLLSPVPHSAVLRHPAIQRLRTFAFMGSITGATANQLLSRRVPASGATLVAWAMWGAVAGAVMGSLFVIAALLIHGLHVPRYLTTAIGTVLLGWQAAVTFGDTNIAGPFDFVGSISRWWLDGPQLQDIAGIAAVALLGTVSVFLAGRLSLEALSRRSALVSQMKFAVTLQDIRTVVLLRRQLSQEHMRVKPWVKVPRILRRDIVVGRGFRSIMHFPVRRLIRMKLLTMTASAALVVAWRGTTPAIVVAGLAMFVVGLDAVEPLSQEVDQPDRTDALPVERGLLMTKHLIVPAITMIPFLLSGVVVAYFLEPQASTIAYAFIIGVPVVLAGVAGASINAVKGAPDPVGGANAGLALPPEMSGMGTLLRAIFPPAIAILGCTPVIITQRTMDTGDSFTLTLRISFAVLMILGLVAGWVRQRDAIGAYFRNIAQQVNPANKPEGN